MIAKWRDSIAAALSIGKRKACFKRYRNYTQEKIGLNQNKGNVTILEFATPDTDTKRELSTVLIG